MGNSRKPSQPLKGQIREMKPMTPEERQEQAARMYMQKRESIATGVLFNMVQSLEPLGAIQEVVADEVASLAIAIADKMIEKLYFTKEE